MVGRRDITTTVSDHLTEFLINFYGHFNVMSLFEFAVADQKFIRAHTNLVNLKISPCLVSDDEFLVGDSESGE
jgi:hypothetical protein